jgi:outer membrane protein OmpA-like peptidoglycan-associated protein
VDKADLRKESTSELNHVVELMTEYPNMVVEVAGHTDNTGTAEHNMALSTERARSVLKYLVDKGIEKKRIVAVGYGMSKPLASNDTEEGKQSNRRTEFKIVKMK